ncbi:FAD binding domain-containing protein [Chloroflexota bacterium]
MIRFELLEPKSPVEACSLLSEYKDKAKIIAGGHGILPLLKHRTICPAYLINIKGLAELDYVKENGGSVLIGALTTNHAIEVSPLIKAKFPMLAGLERYLGDVQIRNWGTVVGNLCMSTPTSDLAPALIALGSSVIAKSTRGERKILLEEFFTDIMKTALEPDEMVTELQIPFPPPHSGSAYHKERVRMTDSPTAAVAVAVSLDEKREKVIAARIILQAVCPTPLRVKEAETLMVGKKITDISLELISEVAAVTACPISDIYGSAEYKKEMVKLVTGQLLQQALEQARTV